MRKYKSEVVMVFIAVWQIFNALGIYPEIGFWLAFVVTIGVVVLVSNLERVIQFFQKWGNKSTYVIEPADPPIFITPPESKE